MKHWRSQGIGAIVYLDDEIVAAKGESSNSSRIQEDLEKAGFVVHKVQSKWESSQGCTWLDFVVNLSSGHITEKIDNLCSQIREVAQQTTLTARYIASIVAKLYQCP